jgi:hypothetical protein
MKKKTPRKPRPKPKSKPKPKPRLRPKPKGKAKNFSKLTQYSVTQKSPFLVALRSKLFDASNNGLSNWPLPHATVATAVPDLKNALEMMVLVADLKVANPSSATPAFAEKTVIDLRAALPWPEPMNADIPPAWNIDATSRRLFRFWETAHGMNYFLESFANAGGGGGGQSNWPPPPPP